MKDFLKDAPHHILVGMVCLLFAGLLFVVGLLIFDIAREAVFGK